MRGPHPRMLFLPAQQEAAVAELTRTSVKPIAQTPLTLLAPQHRIWQS